MEKNILKQKFTKIVFPLVAVVAIALAGYFYSQVVALKKNPQAIAQEEVTDLVAKVSKLVVLPATEVPTIATVSDPEALKDQAFFASAVKGDKVLIYAEAKKAVLYSVLMNKVLDIAPLNIGGSKAVTAPKADTTPVTTTTKTDTTKKSN